MRPPGTVPSAWTAGLPSFPVQGSAQLLTVTNKASLNLVLPGLPFPLLVFSALAHACPATRVLSAVHVRPDVHT